MPETVAKKNPLLSVYAALRRDRRLAAPKRSVGGPGHPPLSSYGPASQRQQECGFVWQTPSQLMNFLYVYILQSDLNLAHFYTGLTENLHARLKKHNGGEVSATAAFRPWHIKTAIAFTDRERAAQFERYLKSASGRAFAKKRF